MNTKDLLKLRAVTPFEFEDYISDFPIDIYSGIEMAVFSVFIEDELDDGRLAPLWPTAWTIFIKNSMQYDTQTYYANCFNSSSRESLDCDGSTSFIHIMDNALGVVASMIDKDNLILEHKNNYQLVEEDEEYTRLLFKDLVASVGSY